MEQRWREIISGQRPAGEDDIRWWADLQWTQERREIEELVTARARGAPALLERALHLLAAADHSWRTVTRTVWSWGREDVLDVGRERHHRARAGSHRPERAQIPPAVGDDEKGEPGRWNEVNRFMAARPPFRLRLELIRHTGPSQESPLPELLILHSRRYWVVSGGHGESVRAAPESTVQLGASGDRWWVYEDGVERAATTSFRQRIVQHLPRLLRPARLFRAFDLTAATDTDKAGRRATCISATPLPGPDATHYAPELIALGPASYSITIDAATGIILAWTAALDGIPAKGQALSGVEIDRPIDETKFSVPD